MCRSKALVLTGSLLLRYRERQALGRRRDPRKMAKREGRKLLAVRVQPLKGKKAESKEMDRWPERLQAERHSKISKEHRLE